MSALVDVDVCNQLDSKIRGLLSELGRLAGLTVSSSAAWWMTIYIGSAFVDVDLAITIRHQNATGQLS